MESSSNFETTTGIIVFVMALLGVISNGGVIFFSRKASVFSSSIGHLIRCEAAGALLFSLVFLLYVSPVLTFHFFALQQKSISARFGHIAIFSHDVCLFSHASISLNRFVAAFFSSSYSKIFSSSTTKTLIWAIPLAAAVATFVHYFESCWLFFSFRNAFFMYDFSSDCGSILAFSIQFPRNVALICICSAIDLASLMKLKFINKRNRSLNLADNEWRRRQRVETALMSQVCSQATMYIIEFLTYFIISGHFVDPMLVFLLTTFAWQSVHTLDGIVVFLFNREMKNTLRRYIKSSPSVVVAPASSGGVITN